ncbi:hypothetical protein Afil01_23220 [Actinorhabdospora filicis]|uniref:Uncharacterized protein n=1 Tax=Actinorhabdospora filicis TaxID=1785913 RepID=A0A9W6SI29_9ACTN|nr:hypothetical protein [Actinorhabdospora filicis]GLZ77515.1 hypothetical protein Afil01_23220 [Actinorhabdospora filicis]
MPSDIGPAMRLFDPGERLGWAYADPELQRRSFPDPRPQEPKPPKVTEIGAILGAVGLIGGGGLAVVILGVIVMIIMLICGAANDTATGVGNLGVIIGIVIAVLGVALGVFMIVRRGGEKSRADAQRREYEAAVLRWESDRHRFIGDEQARIDALPEWYAIGVPAATRRLDVYGGGNRGWSSLLTTYGASAVATRSPVVLLDFSRAQVAEDLCRWTAAAGAKVRRSVLPAELHAADLLSGLTAEQIVAALVESTFGAESDHRNQKLKAHRVLSSITEALGGDITMGRLLEALRVAMRDPARPQRLSAEEENRLGQLLYDSYVASALDELREMEAVLYPLARLGEQRETSSGGHHLDCFVLADTGASVTADLLADLLLHWTTHRLTTGAGGTVIIAGADRLASRHLEHLTDICARDQRLRLVLLFRNLRDDALRVIGGGTVGFMRLGNHQEAEQAAQYIGKEFKFVDHSVTETHGTNEGTSSSVAHSESTTVTDSSGSSGSSGSSDSNWSVGGSRSTTTGTTRTEGTSKGTTHSIAWGQQRVHEYRVEPVVLQHQMAEEAMYLVQGGGGQGARVQRVDTSPQTVALPRSSTTPVEVPPQPVRPALPPPAEPQTGPYQVVGR